MNPNECVLCVTYVIESIDSKLISVCLINDYLFIADLHIFVYGRAEILLQRNFAMKSALALKSS